MSRRPSLAPAASHSVRAVCWAVVDCGAQTWWFEERPRKVREVRLSFELIDDARPNGDRGVIEQRYAYSFWPNANLKRDIEAWLGRALTRAEREGGFDLAGLIGLNARLDMIQRGRWRGVTGVNASLGPAYPPNRPPLFVWLENARFDVGAFHRLPDRLKDRICASATFQALHEDGLDPETLWPAAYVRPATAAEMLGDEIPW